MLWLELYFPIALAGYPCSLLIETFFSPSSRRILPLLFVFAIPNSWSTRLPFFFYTHDSALQPGVPYVLVQSDGIDHEVFEHQRWCNSVKSPGWIGKLLQSDKKPWSDREGNALTREAITLPSTAWQWVEDWRVVVAQTSDADGWEYAVDFNGPFGPKYNERGVVRGLNECVCDETLTSHVFAFSPIFKCAPTHSLYLARLLTHIYIYTYTPDVCPPIRYGGDCGCVRELCNLV